MGVEPSPQAIGGKRSNRIRREAERAGDRLPKQGIANRAEDEAERRLGNVMILVPDGELGNQIADRFEDRIERVAIAGEDHPRGQGPRAVLAEGVEHAVDDRPRIAIAGARALDFLGDRAGHRIGDRSRQRALKPGGRAEMVSRLAWVRPIRDATAFSVTACGPSASRRSRAASTAADRLSSWLKRRRVIDTIVSCLILCG